MKKNAASQIIGAQMINATTGAAFTGAVTVYVTGDAGTQAVGSVGSGACVHEGNGFHTYAPAQAETNYDHIAFTFVGTGAVPATVQVYPTFPQTGDNFARLGAPAGASISADVAAVKAETALIVADTNELQTDWVNGGRLDVILDARASQASVDTIDGIVDSILVDTAEIGAAGAGLTALATQASVNDLPTNAELATALAAADDAVLAAINDLPTNAELATALAAADDAVLAAVAVVDANVDAILIDTAEIGAAGAGLTALATQASVNDLPTNAELATALAAADDAVLAQVALVKAKTDNLPSDPADASDIAAAFSTVNGNLATVAGYIDTEVGAIKAVTDKLDDTLEDDSGTYRFTTNALEQSPAGGGGGGLDAAGVRAAIGLASANLDTQLADLPTNAELATALAAADDAVLAAVADLPTNAELATALGTADDAVLAQIALVKAKTDNLPSDPADASDIAAAFGTVNSNLSTVAGYIDTEVAAIKAKTDNLPASPAATGDIPSAATIADAVLDEAVAGRASGSLGKAVADTDERGARTVLRGTSAGGATTTTLTPSALDPAGAAVDQFKGRIILFDKDTVTAALRGQGTDITGNTGDALAVLTFTALTTAPASGDTFSIV
jgi:hypothetical protein